MDFPGSIFVLLIEFKQIVGRGTRLFDGKDFFTIYDYVDACHHFDDPE
jgi:type I restriction enzyme, R subunit